MVNSVWVVSLIVILITIVTWAGLWRQYRWLHIGAKLVAGERIVLERQIVAMAAYFPIHLTAIVMPIADNIRGSASIVAAVMLAYIGATAIRHKLFVAFNRQNYQDEAAVREPLALAAGGLMLLLSIVILGLGIYLLGRDF